jgi:transposase InsO family protein
MNKYSFWFRQKLFRIPVECNSKTHKCSPSSEVLNKDQKIKAGARKQYCEPEDEKTENKLSGYLNTAKTPGGADAIHYQAKRKFRHVPCQSITYDNGSEFALHQLIERDYNTKVYFADPGAVHQRGANENCNGLLRQYFLKGSSFATITNSDV